MAHRSAASWARPHAGIDIQRPSADLSGALRRGAAAGPVDHVMGLPADRLTERVGGRCYRRRRCRCLDAAVLQ